MIRKNSRTTRKNTIGTSKKPDGKVLSFGLFLNYLKTHDRHSFNLLNKNEDNYDMSLISDKYISFEVDRQNKEFDNLKKVYNNCKNNDGIFHIYFLYKKKIIIL
jgi:hypothetical protein